MADPTVSFRIRVDGAPEASADVERVKGALEGVQGTLDAGGGANQRYTQSSTQMGAAQKDAAVSFGVLGDTSRQTHQQLFEGAKLTRTFADTIGSFIPGLSSLTGEFTRLSRETGGMSVGMVGMTAGLLAGAAAIGFYLNQAKEFREIQLAANKAIEDMDFSAAQQGLSKSVEAQRSFALAIEEGGSVLNVQQDALGQTTRTFSFLSTIVAAVTGDWSTLSAAFSARTTDVDKLNQSLVKNAEAVEATWESYERGKQTLEAVRAELQAQSKALENVAAQATSLSELADAYAEQEQTLRALAQVTIDLKAAEDTRYAAKHEHEIQALEDKGLYWEAAGVELDLEEEMGLRARQRAAESAAADEAAIARAQADEEKLAGFAARGLEDAGKLIDIKNQAAIAAIKAGQDEADIRQKVAEADAKFYGTALSHLEDYQTDRRGRLEAQAQLEITNIEQVYEKDRAALQARADALPAFSLEQNALYDKLDQMDAAHNAKMAEASAKLANARLSDEAKVTEERRANYAREVSLAEANYAQLAAMGQEDVAAHIRWAEQRAQDKNLGKTDQMKYEKEAFDERRKLEQDTFALSKALGLQNEVDVLNHVAAETSRYAEGSMQRIKAETDWATEAKRLRNEVADIGKSAIEKVIGELEAEGNTQISLGMIQQRAAQDASEAFGAISGAAAGGVVDIDKLKAAFEWGPILGAATKDGVGLFQAMGAQMQRTQEQFMGIGDTAKGATQDLTALGVPVAQIGTNLAGVATSADSVRASAAQMGAAIGDATREAVTGGNDLQTVWFGTSTAMAAAASTSDQVRDRLADLGDTGSAKVGEVGDAFRLIDPAALELGSAVSDATAQMAGFGQVGPLEDISHAVDDVLAQFSALGTQGVGSVDKIRAALEALRGAVPPGGLIPGPDPGLMDMPRVWSGAWRSAGAAGAAAMADTGAAAASARARETAALADLAGDAQTLGETERTAATETTTAWQQGALARADAVVASFGRSSDSADDFQKHGLEVADAVSASFGRMVPPDSPYRDLDLSALEFQRHALDTADGVVASFGRMNDSAVYGLPGLRGMDDALDLMGSSADMSTQRVNEALDSMSDRLRDLGSAGGGSVDQIETSFNQLQDSLDTIGGSLGDGFKGTLDATLGYIDAYWPTLNDKIRAGASTVADNIFGTLNDRIKDELDAEARAS